MQRARQPNEDPTQEVSVPFLYAVAPEYNAQEIDLDTLVIQCDADPRENRARGRRGEHPWGKWLVFAPANRITDLWNTVAAAVNAGQLSNQAKVSTACGNEDLANNFVICVYSHWADLTEVRRHLTVLRGLGVQEKLFYKRDNETYLQSRGGHAWYVSPQGDQILYTAFAKNWQPSEND